MRFWYELVSFFAFCFEIDMPEVKPIIMEADYVIAFELPDVRTLKEIRILLTTFAVDTTFNLHSKICWIKIDLKYLNKSNYKQFIELLQILISEKCVEVDNHFYM